MAGEMVLAGGIARALAPVFKEIYAGAKGKLQKQFDLWKSSLGAEKAGLYYDKLSKVKTIWSRDEAIALDSFYFPSRIRKGHHTKVVNCLTELDPGNIVIEGIVGQGKSVFMRHLALSLLKKQTIKELPIFIELRSISEESSLTSLIMDVLSSIGLTPSTETFDHLAKNSKLVLLLDGFDEIQEAMTALVIADIYRITNKYPELKIIISSRPDNAIQNVPAFSVSHLQVLRPRDHEPFLEKLGVDIIRRHDLIDAIKNSPKQITEVINTPLMLSIVVLVYESAQEIPPYLSDFFDALFHVVFTQHDRLKVAFQRKHHSGLSEGELQHLFEAFCFIVMKQGYGRTLNREQFNKSFDQASKYVLNCKCTTDTFRADIIGVACLMLEEGVGLTTFLHKGILDYFSAAFVKRLPPNTAEKFYMAVTKNYSQWKYPLEFLSKIDRYQYSLHYELEYLKPELKKISKILVDRDEKALSDLIYSHCGDVTYEIKSEVRSMKSYSKKDNEMSEILMALPKAILTSLEFQRISKEKIIHLTSQNKAPPVDIDGDSLEFGVRTALMLINYKFLFDSLTAIENNLSNRIIASQEYVAQCDERSKLIDMDIDITH